MTPKAIIFDFDGVIADSEVPAGHALAESLTAIGLPTSFDDVQANYYGHNWQETQCRIEAKLGRAVPDGFREQHRRNAQSWFARGFDPVPGTSDFLAKTTHLPRAIASSSRAAYIEWALERFGFAAHFGPHIYSADGMERGKPQRDIYLIAAKGLGIVPNECLAIEDSPTGAAAAVAAGMQVVGLCAALHIADREGHAESLCALGVHKIAFEFQEILLV